MNSQHKGGGDKVPAAYEYWNGISVSQARLEECQSGLAARSGFVRLGAGTHLLRLRQWRALQVQGIHGLATVAVRLGKSFAVFVCGLRVQFDPQMGDPQRALALSCAHQSMAGEGD